LLDRGAINLDLESWAINLDLESWAINLDLESWAINLDLESWAINLDLESWAINLDLESWAINLDLESWAINLDRVRASGRSPQPGTTKPIDYFKKTLISHRITKVIQVVTTGKLGKPGIWVTSSLAIASPTV
jgi:hypothetical protein